MSRKKEPAIIASSQKVFKVISWAGGLLGAFLFISFIAYRLIDETGEVAVGATVAPTAQQMPASSGGSFVLRLEPGKEYDLRALGMVLPDRNFSFSYLGCVEVRYNLDAPVILCENGEEPNRTPSPNAERMADGYRYPSDIRNVWVTNLNAEPSPITVQNN